MFTKTVWIFGLLIVGILSFSGIVRADEEVSSFEERHKDKDSIFLLYEEHTIVKPDGSFIERFHKVMKVQKDSARDLGEMTINYDAGRQKVAGLKIVTITPDGKRHPATKIQDMTVADDAPMYSDARVKVITQPQVNIGSILDRQYTVVSKHARIPGEFWNIDTIPVFIPIKEYHMSVTFPKKLGIRYKEFSMKYKPLITEQGGNITYRWDIKDLGDDTERGEDYTPPPNAQSLKNVLEMSSIDTWDDFAKWYYKQIEAATSLTPEIKEAAKKIVDGKTLVREKTRAILEYIQDNFRYVSMSFGANAFAPHSNEEIFKNRYGDCKDLSTLARTMLQAVGVESQIALMVAEEGSSDPKDDLPHPTAFNHAFLRVYDPLGGDFYADPLLKGYDIGQYPEEFEMAYTFLVTPTRGIFGRIEEFDANSIRESTHTVVDINGDWSGIFEISRVWGIDASVSMREQLKAMSEQEKAEFYEALEFRLAQGGKVLERKVDGLEQRYGRLRTTVKVTRPEAFPSADGLIVIDMERLERDEAFEKKERREPFFFPHGQNTDLETIFRKPPGFDILYIPSDLHLKGAHFTFSRTYKKTPLGITVKESFHGKRVTLPKEALGELREFHEKLSRQTRQRIVLKKK